MKHVFFIYPNPNRSNPRGIRMMNIIKHLQTLSPHSEYRLLTFSNNLRESHNRFIDVNFFNFIYLILRYLGIFRIGKRIISKARILDPFFFVHFLIKYDLQKRLKELPISECVFVIVVSPFSSYLLIPWIKKKYPKSTIICDIGDPLYRNAARWNNDQYSKLVEYKALGKADYIIVTNKMTKDHFCSKFCFSENDIKVIPQGVDIRLIEESLEGVKVQESTLVYAGRFYKVLRTPQELFKFISDQDKYILNIYGRNLAESIKNVCFHGFLDQRSLFSRLHENEILVFIDNQFGIQTSGKIFEVLSFKKPVLFIKGKEDSATFILAKNYRNVFFADNNIESIKNALYKYENNKAGNIEMFDYSIYEFDWAERAAGYLKLIES